MVRDLQQIKLIICLGEIKPYWIRIASIRNLKYRIRIMYLFGPNHKVSGWLLLYSQIWISAFSEPFLSPNDPFIRHEIRLLGDEGGFNGLQNTWPLDLGGISSGLQESDYSSELLDNRLSIESNSGFSPYLYYNRNIRRPGNFSWVWVRTTIQFCHQCIGVMDE
jgi:hypothetical protein